MWHRLWSFASPALVALSGMTLPAASVQAGGLPSMTPITQDRSIRGFVIVPPCGPPTSLSQFEEASDFGPFEAKVSAERVCDFAHGIAEASQHSEIGEILITAVGESFSEAVSMSTTAIHAISNSDFQVTFALDQTARFILEGHVSAGGAPPVMVGYASAQLINDDDDAVVFGQIVYAAPGGATTAREIMQSALLAPGQYTLRAAAASVIDSMVPPNGSGSSAFDISFRLTLPADLNGDGTIDGDDLAMVLGAWGPCSGCVADIDGDGVVDGDDLALVLGGWTG